MKPSQIALIAVAFALMTGASLACSNDGSSSEPGRPKGGVEPADGPVLLTTQTEQFESWDDVPEGGVGCNQTAGSTVSCDELYLEKMPATTPVWGPDGQIHEVPTAEIRGAQGTGPFALRADGTWGPSDSVCVSADATDDASCHAGAAE